jgi:hypothetical protein
MFVYCHLRPKTTTTTTTIIIIIIIIIIFKRYYFGDALAKTVSLAVNLTKGRIAD